MAGRYEITDYDDDGTPIYGYFSDDDPGLTTQIEPPLLPSDMGTGNTNDTSFGGIDPGDYSFDPKTGLINPGLDPATGKWAEPPDWLKAINAGGQLAKDVLSGKSSYGTVGQLAGYAALGAAAKKMGLVNDGQQGIYRGYEGGIPSLVATRQQVPLGDTTNYRPGQGGRTYFTPTQYVAPSAAGTALTDQRQEAKQIATQQVPVASARSTAPSFERLPDDALRTPPDNILPGAPIRYAGGGGISTLGGYSDGGRMLRGPGDGVSDSIPATIGGKQPARLADGEFVIPARIVSEIGNGSSEAGARKLYAMMDRIQKARKKSIKNVAANTKADKYLPR
jgi:hypothetical protein